MTMTHRQQIGQLGGLRTSASHDMAEVAARAREGLLAKYRAQVDPDGVIAEPERTRRARAAWNADMAERRLKAKATRKANAAAKAANR